MPALLGYKQLTVMSLQSIELLELCHNFFEVCILSLKANIFEDDYMSNCHRNHTTQFVSCVI